MQAVDNQLSCINIYMQDDFESDGIGDSVDDLINQLKSNNKEIKKVGNQDFELKSDEVEQFILNSTGRLIKDSMDMVGTVKEYVECAPDSEGVSSLAELLKATTSSIDTLSKILVQDKREAAAVNLKKIDITAKHQLMEAEANTKRALTRQEVLDELMQNVHEAEIIDDDQDSSV